MVGDDEGHYMEKLFWTKMHLYKLLLPIWQRRYKFAERIYGMKKIALIVLAIVVIAGGIYGYIRYQGAQAAKAAAASIQTAVLSKGEIHSTISIIGTVRARQTTSLYWETTGSVEAVNVKEGDRVKQGDTLASLSQASLPQSVISAQADLVSAQQTLDDLSIEAEQSKVTAMQNIVTYEEAVRDAQYKMDNFLTPTNQKKLTAVEAVQVMEEKLNKARAAFDPYKLDPYESTKRKDTKETLDLAQADYDAAIKRVKYEYDLEVAQANLAKAKQDYNKYKDGPLPEELAAAKAKVAAVQATINMQWIKAPFDGVVTYVVPQLGDQIAQGNSLSESQAFRIDDLSTLFIDLNVAETDIGRVAIGQDATIIFDALQNNEYHGKVYSVDMVGDTSADVVNFTVTVEVTDADDNVRPGMTAEVDVVTDQRENALLIPNQAIRTENDKKIVYVSSTGQTPKTVEVQVGISSDSFSELLSGDLKEGDTVILNPTSTVDAVRRMFMMGGGGGGSRSSENNGGTRQSGGGQP
jgi:HlyD family secretion protein